MLLRARWDGDAFVPLPRFKADADKHLVVEQVYTIEAEEPDNHAARGAYFAELRTLWNSLPETLDDHYPTPTHLRKRALIKCGYYVSNMVTLKTPEEARVVAAIMKPLDQFAVVVVRENVIAVYRARSQRPRANDEDEFRMSKDELKQSRKDVLDLVRSIVNVRAAEARRHLDFG